jgi:hypothetical protein
MLWRCNVCQKQLESNTVQEQDNEAYCKNCHAKFFGPSGYTVNLASRTNERATSHDAHTSGKQVQPPLPQPKSRSNSFDGRAPPRAATRQLGGGSDKCMRCSRAVYGMERVVALKMVATFFVRVNLFRLKICFQFSDGEFIRKIYDRDLF